MNDEKTYDVVIVGAGPAGLTAALYCGRAGFDTLVLEKLSPVVENVGRGYGAFKFGTGIYHLGNNVIILNHNFRD